MTTVSAMVVFVVVVEEGVGTVVELDAILGFDVVVNVVTAVEMLLATQLARSNENTINRLSMLT
jgi:hypothetical protein